MLKDSYHVQEEAVKCHPEMISIQFLAISLIILLNITGIWYLDSMKKITRFALILILLSLWLGWSVLIDFIVVPTTFKTIHDFFNAGELGMGLFMQLNRLEFILASILFSLIVIEISKKHKLYIVFVLTTICLIIASSYLFYLTPKLIYLTNLWKNADAQGITFLDQIGDIQQEHQFYHNIYIRLDGIKILLLSATTFFHLRSAEKWQ